MKVRGEARREEMNGFERGEAERLEGLGEQEWKGEEGRDMESE